ncbi:MAG: type II toxin-antitoxin system VapC family toxin [Desulfobacteraceae bacterium]|nr:type II toxin-antitoxin system VapC family toxin [Desulfobacteraceae bacterium]
MILLDTNVVIAFFNGNKGILERIQAEIDRITLSALVIAELNYGAKASQKAKENLEKLDRFLDIVGVVPFNLECANIFGTIKSKLRKLGKPTGEMDALIAATAIFHKATLITGNRRHFENIEGLKIEIWRTM